LQARQEKAVDLLKPIQEEPMSEKKPEAVILRRREGSHPTVERVYAYDYRDGSAVVLLKYPDGETVLDHVKEEELEAFYDDGPGTLVPVPDQLILRAGHLLKHGK